MYMYFTGGGRETVMFMPARLRSSLASHTPQSQGERGSGDHAYRELF